MSTTTTEPTYTILATNKVVNPAKAAVSFQILLATEKGYSSRVVQVGHAVDVVASDNRAIRFVQA